MSLTIIQVCKEIRNLTKPYLSLNPKMSAAQFSLSLRNIEHNLSKPSTIKSFFNKFGYDGEFNDWNQCVKLTLATPKQIEEMDKYIKESPKEILIPK